MANKSRFSGAIPWIDSLLRLQKKARREPGLGELHWIRFPVFGRRETSGKFNRANKTLPLNN
jgi:hypothetical protein